VGISGVIGKIRLEMNVSVGVGQLRIVQHGDLIGDRPGTAVGSADGRIDRRGVGLEFVCVVVNV
jgi:hypothetical protein